MSKPFIWENLEPCSVHMSTNCEDRAKLTDYLDIL